MRAIERRAIDSGHVTGLTLMERAGAGVVHAIAGHWPHLSQRTGRARILCGPGNNGGDGFVIARLLRARGWQVTLVTFGDPNRLPPDARANFDRIEVPVIDGTTTPATPCDGDLAVDAVFGTGLTRPVTDPALCAWLVAHDRFTLTGGASVAVDIPSGLCADSGRVLGDGVDQICAHSALTVTFHRAKPGHYLGCGPEYCGTLVIEGLGL